MFFFLTVKVYMEHEKRARQDRTKKLLQKQKVSLKKRFSNKDYLDDRWKALRIKALDRDGWCCTACKRVDNLNVHHVRYVPKGKIWDSPVKDLVTLCEECHKLVHKILSGRDSAKKKSKATKRK